MKAAFLALLIIVFGLNHAVAYYLNDGDYTPFSVGKTISASVYDQAFQYAGAIHQFLRTGQPYLEDLSEYRHLPNPYPLFPTLLLGGLAKLTGSLENAWMVGQILFPILLWLLLYSVSGRFIDDKGLRAAVASFSVLIPFGPRNALLLAQGGFLQPPEITRLASPAASFPHLLLAFVLVAIGLSEKRKAPTWWSGAVGGLLFYHYIFYYLAFTGSIALLTVAYFLLGFRDRARLLVGPVILSAVMGLPGLWHAQQAREGITPLLARIGYLSHEIRWDGVFLFLFESSLLWYFLKKINKKRELDFGQIWVGLMLALGATAGAAANINVVSGYDPFIREHFTNRVLQPFFFLTLCFLLLLRVKTLNAQRRIATRALVVAAFVVIGMAAVRQISTAQKTRQDHRRSSPKIAMLYWIRDHVPSQKVIATADMEMVQLMPALAGNPTFVPLALRTRARRDEISHRYLSLCRLEGRDLKAQSVEITGEDDSVRAWLRPSFLLDLWKYPTQLQSAWDGIDLSRVLVDYRMDFLILPKGKHPTRLPVGKFASFRSVHENSLYTLWERLPD